MALRVWLPLNGNLNNQGLSPAMIEAVTAPIYTEGKIGKCLSEGKIKIPAEYVGDIFNNEHMSICFWYNNNTDATSGNHAICGFSGNGDGDSGATRIWDFFNYSTPNIFHWSMGTLGNGTLEAFSANTWVHMAITFDGSNLLIYKNGELVVTQTGKTSAYTFDKSYYISFGKTPQKLNDFRIYDECLSAKQIKEISKGLVAHYKLDGPKANKNYIKNSDWSNKSNAGIYTFDGDVVTFHSDTLAASGISFTQTVDSAGITDFRNKKLTFSMEYQITEALTFGTTNPWVGFEIGLSRNTTTGGSNQWLDWYGGKSIPTAVTNGWVKKSFTVTVTDYAIASTSLSVSFFMRDTIGTIKYRHPKIEIGEVVTPWIPNEADNLYTALGYANNICTDVSGNGYNITKNGTLTFNSDSARYGGSTIFGGICADYLYRDRFTWLASPFTFNCWIYQTSTTSPSSGNTGNTLQFIMSQGRDCGYAGFALCSANGYARLYLGTATSGTYYQLNDTTINLLNGWHMLTGTFDGATARLYVDGVQKATKDSAVDPSWEATTCFALGKMSYGATSSTTAYFPFVGSISDAKIYATALSADDILTLYKNSGIIDNKNNVHAYEFKEE